MEETKSESKSVMWIIPGLSWIDSGGLCHHDQRRGFPISREQIRRYS